MKYASIFVFLFLFFFFSMKDGPTLARSMNTDINCCRHVNDLFQRKKLNWHKFDHLFNLNIIYLHFSLLFPCVYLYAYDVNVELKSMAMKRSFFFSSFVCQHFFEVNNTQSADNKTAWIEKFHHLRISIVFNQYYARNIYQKIKEQITVIFNHLCTVESNLKSELNQVLN